MTTQDVSRVKNGVGNGKGLPLDNVHPETDPADIDLLDLDEALKNLEHEWPEHAKLVMLRYFAGLTIAEASNALGISHATAERHWAFAKAWLFKRLDSQ